MRSIRGNEVSLWVPAPQMPGEYPRFVFFFSLNPLQLLLAVCEKSTAIGTSCQGAMLPSITNVINLADSHDRAAFAMVTHVKQEPRERENSESKEEVMLQIACPSLSRQSSHLSDEFYISLGFLGGGRKRKKTCLYLKVLNVVLAFNSIFLFFFFLLRYS